MHEEMYQLINLNWQYIFFMQYTSRHQVCMINARYTPPTPTRRNCRAESRRRRRCVLGLSLL